MIQYLQSKYEDTFMEDVEVSMIQLGFLICSCLSLMVVGFFLLKSRNFKAHPYPLLAWACLIEGASTFNQASRYLIGSAKFYKILTLSAFGGDLTDFG